MPRPRTTAPPSSPSAGPSPLATLALGAAVLVAYLPALGNGFVWDDDHYVTANAALRTLSGLRQIWLEPGATPQYYPLTFTTLWMEFQLWGLSPAGYHLVNVALHAAGAVATWLVLSRLEVPGAWFAAALFGLHPIAVESVAWVAERKNVLSTVCYLLSALVYLRWAGVPGPSRETGSRRAYAAALLLFVAALLSKTVTASLPAAIALAVWWQRGRLERADLLPLVPFLVLGVAAGLGTAWVERHYVGARGPEFALSVPDRLLIGGRAVWFYLATLAWPLNLTFIYPRWTLEPRDPLQWLPTLAAVAAPVVLWANRRRLGRGPLAATLYFGGTLVPALGFFDVYPFRYSFVADHFAYLAAIGPFALAGAGVAWLAGRRPALGRAAGATLLLVLATLTWKRTFAFRDAETLWRDTLVRNPAAWMAHNNLGVLLYERGDADAALTRYRIAEALAPRTPEIHINLGNALATLGRTEDALAAYHRAIELKPHSAGAHNNLGATLFHLGRTDEAIVEYREAIALRPAYADAHANLGAALLARGDVADAVTALAQAIALRPGHPETHNNLGAALLHGGQPDAARVEFETSLHLRPNYPEAQSNLGNALLALGRQDAAVAAYRHALALRPGYAEAHYNLGHALAALGRREEARVELEEALHLAPNLLPAQRELEALAGPPQPATTPPAAGDTTRGR